MWQFVNHDFSLVLVMLNNNNRPATTHIYVVQTHSGIYHILIDKALSYFNRF